MKRKASTKKQAGKRPKKPKRLKGKKKQSRQDANDAREARELFGEEEVDGAQLDFRPHDSRRRKHQVEDEIHPMGRASEDETAKVPDVGSGDNLDDISDDDAADLENDAYSELLQLTGKPLSEVSPHEDDEEDEDEEDEAAEPEAGDAEGDVETRASEDESTKDGDAGKQGQKNGRGALVVKGGVDASASTSDTAPNQSGDSDGSESDGDMEPTGSGTPHTTVMRNYVEQFEPQLSETQLKSEQERSETSRGRSKPIAVRGSTFQGCHFVPGSGRPSHILSAEVSLKKQLEWRALYDADDSVSDISQVATGRERELLAHMESYADVFLTGRGFDVADQCRRAYAIHAANHILKVRSRVSKHSERLKASAESPMSDEEFRDQGFTRPTVLVVVPYRHRALLFVQTLIKLVMDPSRGKRAQSIHHKKKFLREFSEPGQASSHPNAEYRKYFEGNIDDNFAIGVAVRKNHVSLYADFYGSDVILCSPVGIRRIIGAEGDKERDYDFLSSIEVAIFDEAEIYHMQNFAHLKHLVQHLNLMPTQPRDVDITRIRQWALEGMAKYFRQTIVLSAFATPELNSLLRLCNNRSGQVQLGINRPPSFCDVAHKIPQTFYRVDAASPTEANEARFDYFLENVYPEMSSPLKSHILVFVPSYYDFVRLRGHLKRQDVIFAQICEYTAPSNVSRARSYFFHGQRRFMLYTERYHYHFRPTIRKIKHVIFYQLPLMPQFYPEILNLISAEDASDATCTILFTKYDALRLQRVVGEDRAAQLLADDQDTHLFV